MTVYIVSVELNSESKEFRERGIKGGFVQCFVPTTDIRHAIDNAESALSEDGYSIETIERVELFELDEWHHEPEVIKSCQMAEESGKIEYGPFNTFEQDYEQ